MKMTRRDAVVAVTAALLTGGAMLAAQGARGVLGSQVWEFSKLPVTKTAFGEQRQVTGAPTATLNNLEMHITTLQPGQAPHPPHRHPNEELILLQRGHLEGFVHGKWVPVPEGSILLNASNDLHGVRNPSKTEVAQYFVVNWTSPMTPPASAVAQR